MLRTASLMLAVVLAVVLSACDDEELPAWRTSDERVDPSGLAWAAGSTVHLPDGTEIDTGVRMRLFVVAGDGVFFVPVDRTRDAGAAAFDQDELVFAAPGEPAVGTGMVVSWTGYVGASPDGRYLAVLDREAGEEDRYGTKQATVLAFDLETGEQVIESTYGMGDPETDDFADGYSESEIGISAMTDSHLYVQGVADLVFDLATGEGQELTGLEPSRDLSTGMERERRGLREDAAPRRVVFPAWTYR